MARATSAARIVENPTRGRAREMAEATARARKRGAPLTVVPKVATDDYAKRYAECRALGHPWQHVGLADKGATWQWGSIGYVSVCGHCGTKRTRWFTRSGAYAGRPTYERPEGYSRHGDDRLTMAEWRATWVDTLGIKA